MLGVQACRNARLAEQPRHDFLVRRVRRANHFERHAAIELEMGGAQHDAHSALGERRFDPVFTGNHVADGKVTHGDSSRVGDFIRG